MSDPKPDFAAQIEELEKKQVKVMQELLDRQANWDTPEQQRMRAYATRIKELWNRQDPERNAMFVRHKQERQALDEEFSDVVQKLPVKLG